MRNKLSEHWRTFQEALGIKQQLLAVFVVIMSARADWLNGVLVENGYLPDRGEMIFGFPAWILGIAFALAFLFWWVFRYAHKLRTKIQVARVNISRLRTRGVELRNEAATDLEDDEDLVRWETAILKWHIDVKKAIKEISIADAEWFGTLDVVPPPRIMLSKFVNNDSHLKLYRQHDYQVYRLGEMIRDLWGK